MNELKELTLIKGTYTPEEAREILMNAFRSKIHFHEMKNFSSWERFGKDDTTAVRRIPELKKSKEAILEMIEEARMNNKDVQIHSDIQITLVDKIELSEKDQDHLLYMAE